MAFLTTDEIRYSFNLSRLFKVEDEQVNFASRLAAGDIDDLISDADFAVVTNTSAPTDAAELTKYNRIRDAHGLLTVSKLLLTQTQIRSSGVVTQERDEDGNTTNQYLKPAEAANLRAQYEREAKSMLAPYIAAAVVTTISARSAQSARVRVTSDW